MRRRIEQLKSEMVLVFEHHPWYGQGVMEKIGRLTAEETEKVMAGSGRSICQMVAHMIAWREYAIKKIADPNYKVTINGPVDWPDHTSIDWNTTLSRLKRSQAMLIEILDARDDAWLASNVPNTEFNFEFLIQGITHHDIYHLGQIGLLLRMLREQS